jgi:hypothetical protein
VDVDKKYILSNKYIVVAMNSTVSLYNRKILIGISDSAKGG